VAVGTFVGSSSTARSALPGFREADWEQAGIVSLILEAAYLTGMTL
jgi:hypothetical protein